MTGDRQYRRGHAGLAERKELPEARQCTATNWVSRTRCRLTTRVACGTCGQPVCGIHSNHHQGDWRTACSLGVAP